jgi:hypothetical protein
MEALAAGLLGLVCVVLVAAIVTMIFYFLTLQKALSRVAPHNRLMEPAMVWLALIPLFNIVWNFFIATRVPDSLRNEFKDQGRDDFSDYGKGVGLAYAVLVAVSFAVSMMANPILGGSPGLRMLTGPIGLAALVVLIIFWVRIAGYSRQLDEPLGRRGRGRGYDRDDDYRDEDYPDDYPERGPKGTPSDQVRPDDTGRYRD